MSLNTIHKKRRAITALVCTGLVILTVIANPNNYQNKAQTKSAAAETKEIAADTLPLKNETDNEKTNEGDSQNNNLQENIISSGGVQNNNVPEANPLVNEILAKLEVKGRAPKTGYKRTEFYNGWPDIDGCNLRQRILKRDFGETAVTDKKCNVVAGKFYEPYRRGDGISHT